MEQGGDDEDMRRKTSKLLETDDDETTPITDIYDQVSKIKKIHIDQIINQIAANASKFYNDFKSVK